MDLAAAIEWFWLTIGWVILSVGAVLIVWALLRDRSRNRRCPRCRYDMTGLPSLVCPECGREARSDRELFRRRQRWMWGMLGVALLTAPYWIAAVPRMRSHGWVGAVPDPAMVALYPLYRRVDVRAVWGDDFGARGKLLAELCRRVPADAAREGWWIRMQREALAWQCMRGTAWLDADPTQDANAHVLSMLSWQELLSERSFAQLCQKVVPRMIEHREKWPAGETLHLRVHGSEWLERTWGWRQMVIRRGEDVYELSLTAQSYGQRQALGFARRPRQLPAITPMGPGSGDVEIEIVISQRPPIVMPGAPAPPVAFRRTGEWWRSRLCLPIEFVADASDLIPSEYVPDIEEAVTFRFVRQPLMLIAQGWRHTGIGWTAVAEIQRDEQVVASTRLAMRPRILLARGLEWEGNTQLAAMADFGDPSWRLVIRSDPEGALKEFDITRIWAGEYVVPLRKLEVQGP